MSVTPSKVFFNFGRWFGVGVLVILVIAGLTVGGWQAGWWFTSHNINRETNLIHNSNSFQSAEQSDLSQKIADIQSESVQMDGIPLNSQQYADLHAQRLGEARLACADAAQIIAIPAMESGWVSRNCSSGAVSPSSPLEK